MIYVENFDELAEKNRREHEDWQNSIDGIVYDLNIVGNMYADNEDYGILIAETLQKIPTKIRKNILDTAVFVTDENYGCVYSIPITNPKDGKSFKQPIILLNFIAMEQISKGIKMDVIAHEIAHFVLEHYKYHPKSLEEHLKQEKEADDLIVQWGFNRSNEEVYKDKYKP